MSRSVVGRPQGQRGRPLGLPSERQSETSWLSVNLRCNTKICVGLKLGGQDTGQNLQSLAENRKDEQSVALARKGCFDAQT